MRLDLRGDGKTSSTSALGAVVTVEAGEQKFTRQVTGGRGYLSQSEPVLTIGLGKADEDRQGHSARPGKDAGTQTSTEVAVDKATVLKQGTK